MCRDGSASCLNNLCALVADVRAALLLPSFHIIWCNLRWCELYIVHPATWQHKP